VYGARRAAVLKAAEKEGTDVARSKKLQRLAKA